MGDQQKIERESKDSKIFSASGIFFFSCSFRRMKQLGGQLVIAAIEDLKEEGLMVIVSYFVGGIKLADSGAKEIKFVKDSCTVLT